MFFRGGRRFDCHSLLLAEFFSRSLVSNLDRGEVVQPAAGVVIWYTSCFNSGAGLYRVQG